MDIVVKGRHVEVSEKFRRTASEKLAKLDRFDAHVTRIDVELIEEHNPRLADMKDRVELTCISKGPVIRAEAASSDPIAALDLALERLQARLRKAGDRRHIHHGRRTPASVKTSTSNVPPGSTPAAEETTEHQPSGVVSDQRLGVTGDGPLIVREKTFAASPVTLDEALFEMELVGHDFYLFLDKESGAPSVVYRRRGYDFGVIRLAMEA
ncbi:MAG: ribosomal protein [Frankiales bacterium]|nr:ribosomal protein [Frankiales bacterium]